MRIETLIAGGGLAGLSCARVLSGMRRPYLLVEREAETGGLCRSVERRGFTFDRTGHFLHFKDARLKRWVLSLSPGLFKPRVRRAAVHSHGILTEYPYQENNAGLPSAVALENVSGYLEACLERGRDASGKGPGDFPSWCRRFFGRGISRNFLFPYNRKLWKVPLSRLTDRWVGRFVPRPSPSRVLEGALRTRPSDAGYNSIYHYPDKGGIAVLPRLLSEGLPGVFCGVALTRVDLARRTAHLSSGLSVTFDRLVSSLPLSGLVRMSSGVPARIRKAASRLRMTSVYNINFGLRTRKPVPYGWVYFPGPEFLFHRAGSVSLGVPGVAPPGCSTVYLEYAYRGRRPDAKKLGRDAVRDLVRLGWIRDEKDIVVRVDLDLPEAYAVYDREREEAAGETLDFLGKQGVLSIGRYGRWEYGTMESALEQGREAARKISA